ncbi:hypothetical protein NDU88_004218 [Pleurodeles waltl]|uniref:Secreted protein n=1 Tax=Pleurodeles waltl TaxID=8319 RepID=A0AAV7VK38_PLEWA|nr:hypothetical protein NDU88_004218 [Pleurodeles waltl]
MVLQFLWYGSVLHCMAPPCQCAGSLPRHWCRSGPRRLTAPGARLPSVYEGVAQQGLKDQRSEEGEGWDGARRPLCSPGALPSLDRCPTLVRGSAGIERPHPLRRPRSQPPPVLPHKLVTL